MTTTGTDAPPADTPVNAAADEEPAADTTDAKPAAAAPEDGAPADAAADGEDDADAAPADTADGDAAADAVAGLSLGGDGDADADADGDAGAGANGDAEDADADAAAAAAASLYVGNLHPYVNEVVLHEAFAPLGAVAEAKIIKDRASGASAGYGFVRFADPAAAEAALAAVNGRLLYGQEVRVNWAFQKEARGGGGSGAASAAGADAADDAADDATAHLFVGDLPGDCTDRALADAFASRCAGVADARVMWDHTTGRSRGYGFVAFASRADAEAALAAMHGALVGARRVRCGWAQHRASPSPPTAPPPTGLDGDAPPDAGAVHAADPTGVTVYIGGVPPEASDAEVRDVAAASGGALDVRVHRKGGYAFATYARHDDAVRAIVALAAGGGARLAGRAVRASWGRPAQRGGGGGVGPPPPRGGGVMHHHGVPPHLHHHAAAAAAHMHAAAAAAAGHHHPGAHPMHHHHHHPGAPHHGGGMGPPAVHGGGPHAAAAAAAAAAAGGAPGGGGGGEYGYGGQAYY